MKFSTKIDKRLFRNLGPRNKNLIVKLDSPKYKVIVSVTTGKYLKRPFYATEKKKFLLKSHSFILLRFLQSHISGLDIHCQQDQFTFDDVYIQRKNRSCDLQASSGGVVGVGV